MTYENIVAKEQITHNKQIFILPNISTLFNNYVLSVIEIFNIFDTDLFVYGKGVRSY